VNAVGGDIGDFDDVDSKRGGGDWDGRDKERIPCQPMEVIVEGNIERSIKNLKRKVIREGVFRIVKARKYYEKPSERRKRKEKESAKKIRKDEARNKKNAMLF